MKFKYINLKRLACILAVFSLVGCGNFNSQTQDNSEESIVLQEEDQNQGLIFDDQKYTIETTVINGQTITYRSYQDIVYVSNPVDLEYQTMNIFVPEIYFEGGTIGSYNIETAPIFFANTVGGYMPGAATTIEAATKRDDMADMESNALFTALTRGCVVVSVGARGRTLQDENGNYTGKAPAAIVDLKAAVRYLRYNDDIMPGDANKIISNGTSAGGALSVLLGVTGDNVDYESYLNELGAAPASDAIFAVSAFCPITNLENADMAYEWQFNGINDYITMSMDRVNDDIIENNESNTLTEEEIAFSNELKVMFTSYVNSLGLLDYLGEVLTLDENGEGSFKEYVKQHVIYSAQKALDGGEDLSSYDWITTIEKYTGEHILDIDFDAYVKNMARGKSTMAFDNVANSTAENNLFGNSSIDNQHFTQYSYANSAVGGTMADEQIIKMMNPINYIGQNNSNTSEYFRIRHGSVDKDTSIAIPIILSTILQNKGYNVDFELAWGRGHSGDYELESLFDWIDEICE